MDSNEAEILRILREHGAILERQRSHRVFRFPSRRIFTLPSSPSDKQRGYKNLLHTLKAELGLFNERGAPGERRERRTSSEMPNPVKFAHAFVPLRQTLQEQIEASFGSNFKVPDISHHNRGKKIVHPIHGKLQRQASQGQLLDLSALLAKHARQ
jgi:predicted RNA binding protein YcfA (HicA-like mRNA interferase family)